MKLLGGIFLLFTVLLLAVQAAALPKPQISFVPDQISENGSFVAIVSPGSFDESLRVAWKIPSLSIPAPEFYAGLFPREDNKWVCYFSNIDKDSTCGPTPFRSRMVQYLFIFYSMNSQGEIGTDSVNVSVGNIKLTPEITVLGSTIKILIYPSGGLPTSVEYAIYDSNFNLKQDYKSLNRDSATGYFRTETSLEGSGIFYFAFKASDDAGNFGGEVKKLAMGVGGFVSGEIEVDSVSITTLLNKTQIFRNINNKIKNVGESNLTGLSASVDKKIADKVSIIFERSSLNPDETMYFTVKLEQVENAMDLITYANVSANGTIIGQIPLRLNVSVLNECGVGGTPTTCPVCPTSGAGFSVDPSIWEVDFLTDASPEKSFEISNIEDSVINVLGTDESTGIESVIQDIAAPATIDVGAKEDVTITLSASYASKYSGKVTIRTDQGVQNILIYANAYQDISDDINDAISEVGNLTGQGISSSILNDIESELINAESLFNLGDYEDGTRAFEAAYAKLAVVDSIIDSGYTPPSNGGTGGGDGGDSTGIIIILVIALVILGGVFIYLKKFRGGGGLGGGEESLEEELGAEEEGY
jgi:hypothetical protein